MNRQQQQRMAELVAALPSEWPPSARWWLVERVVEAHSGPAQPTDAQLRGWLVAQPDCPLEVWRLLDATRICLANLAVSWGVPEDDAGWILTHLPVGDPVQDLMIAILRRPDAPAILVDALSWHGGAWTEVAAAIVECDTAAWQALEA